MTTIPLVLSLYPNSRGVGYVLFERPLVPFDWGVKEGRGREKNRVLLRGIRKLIAMYGPCVVVLEDWTDRDSPRCKRIESLYREIAKLCEEMGVPVETVPMRAVRRAFAVHGAETKYEIARLIGDRIPAFSYQIPVRKPWNPEHPRQALFDAAALGLTFFQKGGR